MRKRLVIDFQTLALESVSQAGSGHVMAYSGSGKRNTAQRTARQDTRRDQGSTEKGIKFDRRVSTSPPAVSVNRRLRSLLALHLSSL